MRSLPSAVRGLPIAVAEGPQRFLAHGRLFEPEGIDATERLRAVELPLLGQPFLKVVGPALVVLRPLLAQPRHEASALGGDRTELRQSLELGRDGGFAQVVHVLDRHQEARDERRHGRRGERRVANAVLPECGGEADFLGQKRHQLLTALGELVVEALAPAQELHHDVVASDPLQKQRQPIARLCAQGREPLVGTRQAEVWPFQKVLGFLRRRRPHRGFAHQRAEPLLEDGARLVELEHRCLFDGFLVQPGQVHQHLLRVEPVSVRLERQHQLQVTAAKAHDGILEVELVATERVDEGVVLAVRVEPQHEPAVAHLFGQLLGEAGAGVFRHHEGHRSLGGCPLGQQLERIAEQFVFVELLWWSPSRLRSLCN